MASFVMFVDTEKQLRELSRHKIVYHGRGYAYAAYARACGEGVACEMASTYRIEVWHRDVSRRTSRKLHLYQVDSISTLHLKALYHHIYSRLVHYEPTL